MIVEAALMMLKMQSFYQADQIYKRDVVLALRRGIEITKNSSLKDCFPVDIEEAIRIIDLANSPKEALINLEKELGLKPDPRIDLDCMLISCLAYTPETKAYSDALDAYNQAEHVTQEHFDILAEAMLNMQAADLVKGFLPDLSLEEAKIILLSNHMADDILSLGLSLLEACSIDEPPKEIAEVLQAR